MNYSDQSTQPTQPTHSPPTSAVNLKGSTVVEKVAPAGLAQAEQTAIDDQISYETALSEGWPVSARPKR